MESNTYNENTVFFCDVTKKLSSVAVVSKHF